MANIMSASEWASVSAQLDAANLAIAEIARADAAERRSATGGNAPRNIIAARDQPTALERLAVKILESKYRQSQLLVALEQRHYSAWKVLLLGIGVLAFLTIVFIVGKFLLGEVNLSAFISIGGLIFEGGAATFVSARVKDAQARLERAQESSRLLLELVNQQQDFEENEDEDQ